MPQRKQNHEMPRFEHDIHARGGYPVHRREHGFLGLEQEDENGLADIPKQAHAQLVAIVSATPRFSYPSSGGSESRYEVIQRLCQ